MNIVLIFRAKGLHFFSIEKVFITIRESLTPVDSIESVYVEKPGFKLSNLLFLRKIVKSRDKNTIYHVTGDIHYTVFALPRSRCILTIHDCVFLNSGNRLKKWVLKKLYLDWPVNYVPLVTAISEKTRLEIISKTGCNPGKVRVVNNPVSGEMYYVAKPFNDTRPVLLFIGSTPNKNLNRVIVALKDLSCVLNIIGSPGKDQVEKLNEANIQYLLEINLSDKEIAERYRNADIILFPSLYEGFGLPVIEGFKAGRPVLTSNISPMLELSGGAAWIVDPFSHESIRDGIKEIIGNKEEREKKVAMGLKIAEEYAPEIITGKYQEIYKELYCQIASA